MSIELQIESLAMARNTIRTKMISAGQAKRNDKLSTLASNLEISTGTDTSDATATAADIAINKTAYVNGEKITGTSTKTDTSDATATAADIDNGKTAYVNGEKITGISTKTDTSDATATAADIDNDKTAYVNGEKITGTSTKTDTSDATLSSNANLLTGNTAYANGTKYTGSMTNRGAVSQALNAGGSYTIPAGYHNGSGTVTANSLASQTSATATSSDILSGKTAYVNGSKVTGNITIATSSEITQIVNNIFSMIKPFSKATDKEITVMLEAVRNGDISINDLGWKVGDERKVHLSAMAATGVGESHVEQDQTFIILHGSDMFDLSDGGKNLFVIGLKNMLANEGSREGGYINSSSTNVGGWNSSARRPWCDNVFMKALPAEVQKWFKKFKYKVSAGNKSTTIETLENYFTLPSEIEIFGSTSWSVAGEGSQMDYYKTSANRKKYLGDSSTSADYWWERSPFASTASSFCYVSSTGGANYYNADNTRGLAPFGCV